MSATTTSPESNQVSAPSPVELNPDDFRPQKTHFSDGGTFDKVYTKK